MTRVCVLGATGFLGRALCSSLRERGDSVLGFGRTGPGTDGESARWDPERGELDPALLEGADAVINLAGENLGSGRWSAARKRALIDSRVRSTTLLCERLVALERRPRVLLNASAVGFYGTPGEAVADERSARGEGFLAELCEAWEAATAPATAAGLRVVRLRFGVVLAANGGALLRMLLPFRLGVGGRLGSGTQPLPWVGLEDCLRAVLWCLDRAEVSGPVNVVAPGRIDNAGLARALGRALRRPAVLAVPAIALRLALGEAAQALLLQGAHVSPAVLLDGGFEFTQPDIDGALAALLGSTPTA